MIKSLLSVEMNVPKLLLFQDHLTGEMEPDEGYLQMGRYYLLRHISRRTIQQEFDNDLN